MANSYPCYSWCVIYHCQIVIFGYNEHELSVFSHNADYHWMKQSKLQLFDQNLAYIKFENSSNFLNLFTAQFISLVLTTSLSPTSQPSSELFSIFGLDWLFQAHSFMSSSKDVQCFCEIIYRCFFVFISKWTCCIFSKLGSFLPINLKITRTCNRNKILVWCI